MPSVQWPLLHDRPIIRVKLRLAAGGVDLIRTVLADTGAGSCRDAFELILDEDDCLQCGGVPMEYVSLRGAYVGSFPVYAVDVEITELGFEDTVAAVGVASTPHGFDGIACFRFLSRFTYGNFGDPRQFGLDARLDV